MKTFIIYIDHPKSIDYASQCLKSFEHFSGWEPELFEGITVDTLPTYEEQYNIKMKELSRASDFFNNHPKKYKIKKSCSLNHYRLFRKCVELNEPIAVVEHDSHCMKDWENAKFDDVLVLNAASAIKQQVLKHIWPINRHKIPDGIQDICFNGLVYKFSEDWKGAHIMPGTAAYAITPMGAQKMIDVYENIGWEQSDFIINTHNVRIQTIVPELFTFKLPNLKMSHGVK